MAKKIITLLFCFLFCINFCSFPTFLPVPVVASDGFGHLERRGLDPSLPLSALMDHSSYKNSRRFLTRTDLGKCDSIRWTSRPTSLFYINRKNDVVILIETSAGAIMCQIPKNSIAIADRLAKKDQSKDEPKEVTQYRLKFAEHFLGEEGELTRILDSLNTKFWPHDQEDRLQIYAAQVWAEKQHQGTEIIYRAGVFRVAQDVQNLLKRYYCGTPSPLLYKFVLRSGRVASDARFTAGVWYQPHDYLDQMEAKDKLEARATIFLGNTGAVHNGIHPVGTVDLWGPPIQFQQYRDYMNLKYQYGRWSRT